MRIVQTFWTAKRLPLLSHFGWAEPEYNLMSWTLSCYSLRKHYDEVALYTDTAGKHLLIDMLHLPYTEVNVVFDDFPCLPQHWALSKIKTYSLQTKPFLHVDGDVFLPNPLPKEIEEAPLVAQNREIGTGYYRNMMNNILRYPEIHLADYVMEGLRTESIASYNMGIFGGNDLDFIHRYCQESFSFMEENHMNDEKERQSRVDCNVFFEQMLFAIFADNNNRDVASVLGRPMIDEGYSRKEFCNLDNYEDSHLFHILGGHKRNKHVLKKLESTMLRHYPDMYRQIISLYPAKHVRFNNSKKSSELSYPSAELCIAQYEDFRGEIKDELMNLDTDELFLLEAAIARYPYYLKMDNEHQQNVMLSSHPYIKFFQIPSTWHPRAIEQVKEQLDCEKNYPLNKIAFVPALKKDGVRETPVLDIGYKIIKELQKSALKQKTMLDIIAMDKQYMANYSDTQHMYMHAQNELRSLVRKGLVIPQL